MSNISLRVFWLSTLGFMAAFVPSEAWAAEGDNYSVGVGFDYSTGDYGSASTTNILTVPIVGIYKTDLWQFSLTVPFVRISGDGSVVPGMGGSISDSKSNKTTSNKTRSGLGDVVTGVTYNVYSGIGNDLGVDLTGKIKFATADTSLGSGRNDYAAQVSVYKGVERFINIIALGYQILGDPSGNDLNNSVYGKFGIYYKLTDHTTAGAEVSLSQKLSTTIAEQRELTVHISHSLNESLRINGYVLKGFSDGSPDRGLGALITSDL